MDIGSFGDDKVFNWTREHLLTVLTTGKKPLLTDPALIDAFVTIDRAVFLPESKRALAYADKEVEFGFGQSLDSPVVIAQMLASLDLKPGMKVLELGTGTGYTAALLGLLLGKEGRVFTIERNQQILEIARANLAKYPQIKNVEFIFGDGSAGIPARAPYDAIHTTFAYDSAPEALLLQLKLGGKLVTPLTTLEIKLYTRVDEHNISEQVIAAKHFAKHQPGVE